MIPGGGWQSRKFTEKRGPISNPPRPSSHRFLRSPPPLPVQHSKSTLSSHFTPPQMATRPPPPAGRLRDPGPPPPTSTVRHRPTPPPEANAAPSSSPSSPKRGGGEGNVDPVLIDSVAEMVRLVERFMDQRTNSSFRRRASVTHTPAPPNPRKATGSESQKGSSVRKRMDGNLQDQQVGMDREDGEGEGSSIISRPWGVECAHKDREEIGMLREQVDELQRRLQEKGEQMKVVENSLNDLKREAMEKDTLIRSYHSQLNNAKIKLADKQAALEKLEWEAREASNNNMKLQGKLDSIDLQVSSFMRLFMELSKREPVSQFSDETTYFDKLEQLPFPDVDESAMEEARLAYVNALAAAKKNPSEQTLSIVSEARLKLQSFVL